MAFPGIDLLPLGQGGDNLGQAFEKVNQWAPEVDLVVRQAIAGDLPGWNMATVGADPEQPEALVYSKGTQRLRMALTWNVDGLVTVAIFAWSENSGASYTTYATQAITYDAGGNVTAMEWT